MIKRAKNLFLKKEIRFLAVGGLNTAVGYGSYALFVFLGLNYLLANILATVIGIINSYIWNRLFTFKSRNKPAPEFARFVLVYGASFVLGMAVLYLLVAKAGMNKYAAGAINLALVVLVSWFGHNHFSFKKETGNNEGKKRRGKSARKNT